MKLYRHSITRFLQQLPVWQLGGGSFLILGVIWMTDYFIRVDLGLSIFYVLPIAAIAWYINFRLGYFTSGLSALLWFIAEAERVAAQPPLIFLIWNTAVRLAFFVLVVALLAELKTAYRQEQYLAKTDFLTSLLNRRAFTEMLDQEIQRSRRYILPFTLAYLDVDNFKQVNDHLGHAEGDRLLQEIAIIFVQQLRATDHPARLGGDEFAILMPQTDDQQAALVLKRLFAELSNLRPTGVNLGFSIGAVTFSTAPASTNHALAVADQLMYSVKENGKNQYIQDVYTSEPHPSPNPTKGAALK